MSHFISLVVEYSILILCAPWAHKKSQAWIDSFKQWQIEDQYYQERKAQLLLYRQEWELYLADIMSASPPFADESINFVGKCVQDRLQAIDNELNQLKEYYGY